MKFLFVARQKKNVDAFEGVLTALLGEGHSVTLAIQERDVERDHRLASQFSGTGFTLATCPEGRGDAWRTSAPLVRSVHDWAQYFRSPYRQAAKLRRRAARRLLKELGAGSSHSHDILSLGAQAAVRLQYALGLIEQAIPSDGLHEEFFAQHEPDVVLVTPGVTFGSGQADFMKSARARRIPVWMLLFSWDNLSTKGALHLAPDLMFVWNERQRREAVELHDFPAERVAVVGAPRFDEFFSLRSTLSREDFVTPLGLDPIRPILLYLCSSRFIADRELEFIRKWLRTVRQAAPPLRDCSVIVRPHPDVALIDDSAGTDTVTWRAMPQATGWIQRPFDDQHAVILRTTYRTQQAFYECLHHAKAVVALNTSAELEAGIVGRPVLTVLAQEEAADGQANTLHFDYLLRERGGFVDYAPNLQAHVEQLTEALSSPPRDREIRRFIMDFLRPHGDQPVAEQLARELVGRAERRSDASVQTVAPDAAVGEAVSEDAHRRPKVLRVGDANSSAMVLATPETRRFRRHGVLTLDPAVTTWLADTVRPGDVVYDIGAGIGACAILAAVTRGSLAVAFEPGFGAFKALCDNLLLNSCYRSVVPLPIAVGDRTGLLELPKGLSDNY